MAPMPALGLVRDCLRAQARAPVVAATTTNNNHDDNNNDNNDNDND